MDEDIFDVLPGLVVVEVCSLEDPEGIAVLFEEGVILTMDDEFGAVLIRDEAWKEVWASFNS